MHNRHSFQDEHAIHTLISKIKIAEEDIKLEINNKNFADKIELLLQSCSFANSDAIVAALAISMDTICLLYMLNAGFNQLRDSRVDFITVSAANFATLLNLGASAILYFNKSVFYDQPLSSLHMSFPAIRDLMKNLPNDIPDLKEMNFSTPIHIFLERIAICRQAAETMLEDKIKQKFHQTLQQFGFSFRRPNLVVYDPENPLLKEIINQTTNPKPRR